MFSESRIVANTHLPWHIVVRKLSYVKNVLWNFITRNLCVLLVMGDSVFRNCQRREEHKNKTTLMKPYIENLEIKRVGCGLNCFYNTYICIVHSFCRSDFDCVILNIAYHCAHKVMSFEQILHKLLPRLSI